MRLLSLAKAAWAAEELHLRRLVRSRGMQAGYAAAAVIFLVMMLVMLHLAAFAALEPGRGPVVAAMWVAAGDLVLLALLAWMASRAGHDPVADEAVRLRQEAVRQIGDQAARAMVLAPLLRSQNAKKGLLGAAVTAVVVGLLSRR
ncbi:hypothetical protein [Falsiroseomonas sp. HW251]|uniref:hypothetical protein n=1 Tax=Falsiroseomonas sp. HW251 TaxID=3390998 RepID=UPI003D321DF9